MLKILIQSAVIAAFAFAVSVASISAWRSFHPQEQQANDERSTEEPTSQSNNATPASWAKDNPEQAIARYNLWLMVFTGALAFVALLQIGFMFSADSTASKSADAAKDSADVAKGALLIGQRAYVFVTFNSAAIVTDPHTKNVTGWNITPVWNNSGPTPTRNLTNHISSKAFDGEMPPDWHFPDIWAKNSKPDERVTVLLPLGPRSTLNGQAISFEIQDVRDAVAGKKALYIWGWAKYNDVFPDTSAHITRFANRIVISGDPTNPDKVSVSYPLVNRYNCTDDECERTKFPNAFVAKEEIGPN